jgi:hypothetical protein
VGALPAAQRESAGMSRPARPLGRRLGWVALIAVLAITTGWNAPPGRPRAAASAIDRTAISERLQASTAERALDWAAAWDSRAGAGSPVGPVVEAAPAAPPVAPRPVAGARTDPAVKVGPEGDARAFTGRNHFWIPTLGMSTKIVAFPCPRKRPPDNYMYRWGCAERNNVYILGHAYSVMKPLYNAYMSGRLHVGMVAVYADGTGRIRSYRVTEWRVVDPAEGVWWAIAAQPVPSMTLQTCVGAQSQWRLNVRLVAID